MKIAKEKIYAVIMAGGRGERLWPLSTDDRPKPLISIDGKQTLLEETVQRLFPLFKSENIVVIADKKSAAAAKEMLPIPRENIIAEPCRRNTAPCIALATALIKRKCPDAFTAVLPADHKIAPLNRFQEDLTDCIEAAADGNLITLGITPDKPATSYGYIKTGQKIAPGLYKVEKFKEKPDSGTAKHYMEDGSYWWNCGIFVWQIPAIINAFAKYHSQLYAKTTEWSQGKDFYDGFDECEKISIDYAVMEKADNVVVKQASFQWNDLGTLQSLYESSMKDFYKNAVNANGTIKLDNCCGNLIYSDDDTEIRVENMKHCAIIKSGKSLLIKPMS